MNAFPNSWSKGRNTGDRELAESKSKDQAIHAARPGRRHPVDGVKCFMMNYRGHHSTGRVWRLTCDGSDDIINGTAV